MPEEPEPDLIHSCSLENLFNVEIRGNQGWLTCGVSLEKIEFCPYCGSHWTLWESLPHLSPAEYDRALFAKKTPNSI